MNKLKPLKIYLDQKDYSLIARGLAGEAPLKQYIEFYHWLKDLVKAKKIMIYFSLFHIVEAMRYKDHEDQKLNSYCEVLDELTNGNCIIFWPGLIHNEIELFLKNEFHFQSKLDKLSYAYGRYKDVLIYDKTWGETVKNSLILAAEDGLAKQGHSKRQIAKILNKYKKEYFKKSYATLNEHFKFKNLIALSYNNYPMLRRLKDFGEDSFADFDKLIYEAQKKYETSNSWSIDIEDIKRRLVESFLAYYKPEVMRLSQLHSFSPEKALELMRLDECQSIPSACIIILLSLAYLSRHKGGEQTTRKPYKSDMLDLYHATNIPHVDIFITDKFFASFSHVVAQRFGTKVLRSLSDLQSHINEAFPSIA